MSLCWFWDIHILHFDVEVWSLVDDDARLALLGDFFCGHLELLDDEASQDNGMDEKRDKCEKHLLPKYPTYKPTHTLSAAPSPQASCP